MGGMSSPTPMEFADVTAVAKANVYFDGKVVSHTVRFADGSRKTLGIIFPGTFFIGTDTAEIYNLALHGALPI